jgi:hypothetical protein
MPRSRVSLIIWAPFGEFLCPAGTSSGRGACRQAHAASSLGAVGPRSEPQLAQAVEQALHDRKVHAADNSGVFLGEDAKWAVGQGQPGWITTGLIAFLVKDPADSGQ